MNTVEKRVSARLSLRDPQRESLNILVNILEKLDLSKDADLFAQLELIKISILLYKTLNEIFLLFVLP